jgi:hypothetical protein
MVTVFLGGMGSIAEHISIFGWIVDTIFPREKCWIINSVVCADALILNT